MMTIEEIAKRLDDCATKSMKNCADCIYQKYEGLERCQAELIKEMGAECRKIVEQMGDDGK